MSPSRMDLRVLLLGFIALAVSAEECRDEFGSQRCSQLESKCFWNFISRRCQKTCGKCSDTSAPATAQPGPACGIPAVQQSRVIGGEDAKPGAWPWQIAMFIKGRFACGGSLVTPEWIVTAAHCVQMFSSPSAYTVILGAQDLRVRESSWQEIQVSKVIAHPSYGRMDYDIALLKLARPAILTRRVRTVCLPEAGDNVPVGTKCFITGFGKTRHPGGSSPVLQQTDLPVVSHSTCANLNTRMSGIEITSRMVCAGYGPRNIKSGCHGDSGGPFVCQYGNGNAFTLQGAVSWGSAQCNTRESYSVFARISEFRRWIDAHIKA